MNAFMWVVVGIVVVGILFFRSFLGPEDLEENGPHRKNKDDGEKSFGQRALGLMKDQIKEAWNKSKGSLKTVLFLIPYYLIAFTIYSHYKEAWVPWPKNPLLFFVLIPLGILFPVIIRTQLDKEKRALPMTFALLFLGLLLAAGAGKYSETRWWEDRKAELQEISWGSDPEPKKIVSWLLDMTLPPDEDFKFEPGTAPPYPAQLIRDDESVLEVVFTYPHKFGSKKTRLVWDKTINPDYGTWQQLEPLTGGTWKMFPDPSGIGYSGTITFGHSGRRTASLRLIPVYEK